MPLETESGHSSRHVSALPRSIESTEAARAPLKNQDCHDTVSDYVGDSEATDGSCVDVTRRLLLGRCVNTLVHESAIFRDCGYDFVETIVLQMRKHVFSPAEVIIEEGSYGPPSMFFIIWGKAASMFLGDKCEFLEHGQSFGSANLLGAWPTWKIGVTAQTRCLIFEIQKEVLEATLEEYPEEVQRFRRIVERLSGRLAEHSCIGWQLLRRCAVLRSCSPIFLQELYRNMDRRLYFPGQELFHEHDEHNAFFVIDFGAVSVKIAGRVVREIQATRVQTKIDYGKDYDTSTIKRVLFLRCHPTPNLRQEEPGSLESVGTAAATSRADAHTTTAEKQEQESGFDEDVLCGEEEILGLSRRRSYGAVACQLTSARFLFRKTFLRLLESFPHEREVLEDYLVDVPQQDRCCANGVVHAQGCDTGDDIDQDAVAASSWKLSSPSPETVAEWFIGRGLFSANDGSPDLFKFLASHLETRMLIPGQRLVFDEFRSFVASAPLAKVVDSSMFRIHWGRIQSHAVVDASDPQPSTMASFEEHGPGAVVSGNCPCRALEVSLVSVLHSGVLARGLETLEEGQRNLVLLTLLPRSPCSWKGDARTDVKVILRDRSIFSTASSSFLDAIVGVGKDRVFVPGDRIVQQGAEGVSMFVLTSGFANVVTEESPGCDSRTLHFVSVLPPGSVFGELVMLGVQSRRSTSIIASTTCLVWEVELDAVLTLLKHHPPDRANLLKLVDEQLVKLVVPGILCHQLFSGFPHQFRAMLAGTCERKSYFPKEVVFREGSIGERLYILNFGEASVELHHQPVMIVCSGSYFGFAMIAAESDDVCRERFTYPVTIVTQTICQVLIVPREAYQAALHKFPETREVGWSLKVQESSRVERQRACFLRMLSRRRGLKNLVTALWRSSADSISSEGAHKDELAYLTQSLQLTFHGWRNFVARHQEVLQKEGQLLESSERRIDEWLEKRREKMAQVKPRLDVKCLVDHNLSHRGPLKLAKRVTTAPASPALGEVCDGSQMGSREAGRPVAVPEAMRLRADTAPCTLGRSFRSTWEDTKMSPYLSPRPFLRSPTPNTPNSSRSVASRRLPPLRGSAQKSLPDNPRHLPRIPVSAFGPQATPRHRALSSSPATPMT
eukprot:TRINITY_DN44693_c0_g1_i1.p1 TRINITY_DN44693_c0_g1~~TRINITY_DN44693_c0_g1_i1.p1  ORF type:complete len:1124 (+),score=122.98 TRINITY_DN44693_c0_g1_i1:103-3474(+)